MTASSDVQSRICTNKNDYAESKTNNHQNPTRMVDNNAKYPRPATADCLYMVHLTIKNNPQLSRREIALLSNLTAVEVKRSLSKLLAEDKVFVSNTPTFGVVERFEAA